MSSARSIVNNCKHDLASVFKLFIKFLNFILPKICQIRNKYTPHLESSNTKYPNQQEKCPLILIKLY